MAFARTKYSALVRGAAVGDEDWPGVAEVFDPPQPVSAPARHNNTRKRDRILGVGSIVNLRNRHSRETS
jgi:hypothetical protein